MASPARRGNSDKLRIAVVTATWNRRVLLERLWHTLIAQSDLNFVWAVVDDGSDDTTREWLTECSGTSVGFETAVLVNDANIGKCASLNRVFDGIDADFYLIVDSDDQLFPDAIAAVRLKAAEYADQTMVGAIFFTYQGANGALLGTAGAASDLLMSRAAHDVKFGKYDGCVGYYKRTVAEFRYPEFESETYVGPTVLQLLMAPKYLLAFTHITVGVAEYQSDGLTATGRVIRLRSPFGMMIYSHLRAKQANNYWEAVQTAAMFHAYRHIADIRRSQLQARGVANRAGKADFVGRILGVPLAWAWKRRYLTRDRVVIP